MLTTHFGKTDIRKQEMHGTVEVSRSFVHRKNYYKHILSFMFCLRYICTTFFSGITMYLNKRESTQPSIQIADFLGKWILRGIRFKNVFLFVFISLVFVKQIIYPLPLPTFLGIMMWTKLKKTLQTLKCFNTQYNFTNGF